MSDPASFYAERLAFARILLAEQAGVLQATAEHFDRAFLPEAAKRCREQGAEIQAFLAGPIFHFSQDRAA